MQDKIYEKVGNFGKFLGGFVVKSELMIAKTHSGYCGTVENGPKRADFLRFFWTFGSLFQTFGILLGLFWDFFGGILQD